MGRGASRHFLLPEGHTNAANKKDTRLLTQPCVHQSKGGSGFQSTAPSAGGLFRRRPSSTGHVATSLLLYQVQRFNATLPQAIIGKPSIMKQSVQELNVLNFQLSRQLRLINADLKNRGIHKSARELFLFLWRGAHARKPNGKRLLPKGPIFKVETLAKLLDVHERTVQRNIRLLEGHGLLHISANKAAQRGGHPTNRLWPIWQPARDAAPEPQRVIASLDLPSDEAAAPEPERFQMEATAVFIWPEVSPSITTACHHGSHTEGQAPPDFERSFAVARDKDQTYSKSDQPIPGRPVYVFDSAAAVRLFLLVHLEAYNVARSATEKWIAKFGLARTAQVAQWVFASEAGVIEQPGGWMRRALEEQWTTPTAIANARKAALTEAKAQERDRHNAEEEQASKERSATVEAQRNGVWAAIVDRLDELPDLYAMAETKARHASCSVHGEFSYSAFQAAFKPGGPSWRAFLIDAALERPELWADVSAAS